MLKIQKSPLVVHAAHSRFKEDTGLLFIDPRHRLVLTCAEYGGRAGVYTLLASASSCSVSSPRADPALGQTGAVLRSCGTPIFILCTTNISNLELAVQPGQGRRFQTGTYYICPKVRFFTKTQKLFYNFLHSVFGSWVILAKTDKLF